MYFGLDVHKAFIQVCKLNGKGVVEANYRIGGDRKSIEDFAKTLKCSDEVVLETTFHSYSIFSILQTSKAKRVVVSDSNQVKAIAHARVKTDKVDAEILAQLLRADFIPAVEMPSEQTWSYRQLVSHLRLLSKNRTMLKNWIWGVLNKNIISAPYEDIFTKKGRRALSEMNIDRYLRLQLDNLLNLLEANDLAVTQAEEELKEIAKKESDIQLLLSIPGVGMKVALRFISAIGDINRFDSPNKLASYFGLTPSVSQSANKEYKGSITKEGTSYGRWLAVEAAQSMALSGSPITASYYKIKNKKGHNIAITALARKLIVVVWHMLKNQQPYRYARPERASEKLRAVHPDLPTRRKINQERITTEEIYRQAALPNLSAATSAENRAAIRNKKTVTSNRKQKNPQAKHKVKSELA